MKIILLVWSMLIGADLIAADTNGLARLQTLFRPLPSPITCRILVEEVSGDNGKEIDVYDAIIDWPRFFLSHKNGNGHWTVYGTDGTTEWLATERYLALATREGVDNFSRCKRTRLDNDKVELFIDLIGLQYLAQVLGSQEPSQVQEDAHQVSFNFYSTNLDLTRNPSRFVATVDKGGGFSSLCLSNNSTATNRPNLSFAKIIYSDLKKDALAGGWAAGRIEISTGDNKGLKGIITYQKALNLPPTLFKPPVSEIYDPFTRETMPVAIAYDAREDTMKSYVVGTNLIPQVLSFREACLRSPLSPDTVPASTTNLDSQSN